MLDERMAERMQRLRPAERRVAEYFRDNREQVLLSSATALAQSTRTSDATVVRTAKALGYSGMNELKRALADELRRKLTPADRMERTLDGTGSDLGKAFTLAMEIHEQSLSALRQSVGSDVFADVVDRVVAADRVCVFGIGPSSAMADYSVTQLRRIGLDAIAMTRTGLLFADDLRALRSGDLVVMFAYGRTYPEVDALLDLAGELDLGTILVTDTLGPSLGRCADLCVPVPRGRADMLSMHTATLAFIEALLLGAATLRPRETVDSLNALNRAREKVVGKAMDLGIGRRGGSHGNANDDA